jgi:hypothetical protein
MEKKMPKKINKLRCLVRELKDRYGPEDSDVKRLVHELDTLEHATVAKQEERRAVQICRYSFGSVARQHFRNH